MCPWRFPSSYSTKLFPVLVLGVLAACSSGDAPTDPDGNGSGELTTARRFTALRAVADKLANLSAATPDARRAEFAAYLASLPEFEDSGVNENGSLWARFSDGRVLLFPLVPDAAPPQGGDAGALTGGGSAAQATWTSPAFPSDVAAQSYVLAELPASTQARFLEAPGGQSSIPSLSGMVQARGYQVVRASGTVEDLMAASGDGIFYYGGHGGLGYSRNLQRIFGVSTATPLSERNDSIYLPLWADTSLVYTIPITSGIFPFRNRQDPLQGVYAFTAAFVRKHMQRFAHNSVVYMAACSGGAYREFREAFLNKGAGVFFGWTHDFWANEDSKASLFLFDRMLGLNDPGVLPVMNPPQRPFDYVSVFNDMDGHGLTTSASATLTPYPGDPQTGLLAPSIKHMYVDEDARRLVLAGKFGSVPGVVEINGANIAGGSWSADTIRVPIPTTGPLSAGNVVVYSLGRRSNTRRLTEWTPTFNLEFAPGGGSTYRWEGEVHVQIRADVASFREQSGRSPVYRQVPFKMGGNSHGELNASGSEGGTSWGGTATITNRIASPAAANTIDGIGEFSTQSPALRLAMFVSAPEGMEIRSTFGNFPLVGVWAYGDGPLSATNPLPAHYLLLNRDFEIIGDFRRAAPTVPSTVLFWSNYRPFYVPSDSLAR